MRRIILYSNYTYITPISCKLLEIDQGAAKHSTYPFLLKMVVHIIISRVKCYKNEFASKFNNGLSRSTQAVLNIRFIVFFSELTYSNVLKILAK